MRLTMVGTRPPPYVDVSPQSVQFGFLQSPESAVDFQVKAFERSTAEGWLSRPECTIPGLTVHYAIERESILGEDLVYRSYRFTCKFDKLPKIGVFSGKILFFSGSDTPPVFLLPVQGEVRPPLYPNPSHLIASVLPGEPPSSMMLTLTFDESVVQPEAKPELPKGSPILVTLKSNQSRVLTYQVNITALPSTTSRQTITFRTNHPAIPTVEVPLTIMIVKGEKDR